MLAAERAFRLITMDSAIDPEKFARGCALHTGYRDLDWIYASQIFHRDHLKGDSL